MLLGRNRSNTGSIAKGKYLPTLKEFFQMNITFTITVIAWVFFRADNMSHAIAYLVSLFTAPFYSDLVIDLKTIDMEIIFIFIGLLILTEWVQREKLHGLDFKDQDAISKITRRVFYFVLGSSIFIFGNFNKTEFIYFAF